MFVFSKIWFSLFFLLPPSRDLPVCLITYKLTFWLILYCLLVWKQSNISVSETLRQTFYLFQRCGNHILSSPLFFLKDRLLTLPKNSSGFEDFYRLQTVLHKNLSNLFIWVKNVKVLNQYRNQIPELHIATNGRPFSFLFCLVSCSAESLISLSICSLTIRWM